MSSSPRPVWSVLLFALLAAGAAYPVPVAEEGVTLDGLVRVASRYGTSGEERAKRDAAREMLIAEGSEGLGAVLAHAHLRSGEIHMLIDHMVRHMDKDHAVPALVTRVSSPHARTRRVAAYFLGYFEAPEHAGLVVPLLDDDEVRRVALRTLGKWRVADALPRIIACLTSEEERSRVAAANALRDIGDTAAIPALVDALDDPFFTVRRCAERALKRLGYVSTGVTPEGNGAATRSGGLE